MKLHDAVLKEIRFDWKERIVACVVVLVSGTPDEEILKFSEVRNLVVPSTWEWGGSSSINEFRAAASAEGFLFSIEMQSGDTILVSARDATLLKLNKQKN